MIKIFISSVQAEFAEERMLLKAYIEKSPLLRRFFSVFVFEADVPPTDRRTDEVYLAELRNSDLCLFLIGRSYGGVSGNGISPTEREYDEATDRGIQCWHLTSEVKCVHWHGIQRVKPIRSYKVYKGTLFDMADQAVEFVMAKLDYSVGVRNHGPEVDRDYEIPEEVVSEAIINAIAHRDYLSMGSVQIELFADRLEIYNPGSINPALTPEKLKERHGSFPNNPLIAEPLYLTKYIERLGSGLTDLIEHCRVADLPDPEFYIDRFEFGIVIRRKGVGGVNDPVNGGVKDVDAVNDAVNNAVNDAVNSLYKYIKGHPGLNGRKLAVALSRSEPTIDRQVKALKVKGLVEFRGAPKNGGYYVK